jgi:hypothetical protein
MRAVLLDAAKAVRQAKEAGESALGPQPVQGFVDRSWQAVRAGLSFHRALPAFDPSPNSKKRQKQRPGHNLLIRFKTFKDETLRFLVDFDVPFTNNLAIHQQPGRTGPAHDQGQNENLGLVPNLRRRRRFRSPPIRRLDRPKTRLQHPPRPERKPRQPPRRYRRLKSDGLAVTFFI